MAPTIKWQRWDSASYDWFGTNATDALPALEAELNAWIATVNSNPSNAGRQVTKERGYASSTTANYAGLVISCGADNNTSKGYMMYYTHAGTKRFYFGDTYTNDASNGGYGTVSGGRKDTNVSWYTSGQEASWLLVTGTVDGEEYFCFGPSFGSSPSSTYQDGFMIYKCTDGEWSMQTQDGALYGNTHYFDDAISTGWSNCSRSDSQPDSAGAQFAYSIRRWGVSAGNVIGNSVDPAIDGVRNTYAASPDIYELRSGAKTGDRLILSTLGTGDNVYLLTGYYNGPQFLVDLRS